MLALCALQAAIRCNDALFLDLLEQCLRWDPAARITPDAALQHPWILDAQGQAAHAAQQQAAEAAAVARMQATLASSTQHNALTQHAHSQHEHSQHTAAQAPALQGQATSRSMLAPQAMNSLTSLPSGPATSSKALEPLHSYGMQGGGVSEQPQAAASYCSLLVSAAQDRVQAAVQLGEEGETHSRGYKESGAAAGTQHAQLGNEVYGDVASGHALAMSQSAEQSAAVEAALHAAAHTQRGSKQEVPPLALHALLPATGNELPTLTQLQVVSGTGPGRPQTSSLQDPQAAMHAHAGSQGLGTSSYSQGYGQIAGGAAYYTSGSSTWEQSATQSSQAALAMRQSQAGRGAMGHSHSLAVHSASLAPAGPEELAAAYGLGLHPHTHQADSSSAGMRSYHHSMQAQLGLARGQVQVALGVLSGDPPAAGAASSATSGRPLSSYATSSLTGPQGQYPGKPPGTARSQQGLVHGQGQTFGSSPTATGTAHVHLGAHSSLRSEGSALQPTIHSPRRAHTPRTAQRVGSISGASNSMAAAAGALQRAESDLSASMAVGGNSGGDSMRRVSAAYESSNGLTGSKYSPGVSSMPPVPPVAGSSPRHLHPASGLQDRPFLPTLGSRRQ